MDFTEQELLIERLDNWGRVYGERRATVMGTLGFSLKVARVDGKPARIYQKKVEPKDEEDVPF